MVHLWQQHYGKPSRSGYHNKEWASKMKEIGLQPVGCTDPDKETGQSMTHTVIGGGRFDLAVAELLSTGYTLQWRDAITEKRESTAKKNKVVYVCGSCETKVWGKSGLKVLCGDCDELLQEVESEHGNA
jgi:Zn finger protein HypA/HybF involved in hydrogenase expression